MLTLLLNYKVLPMKAQYWMAIHKVRMSIISRVESSSLLTGAPSTTSKVTW